MSTKITFLGHSSLLIESNGVRLLTDPILRERVTFLYRVGPAIHSDNYQNIDAVLISHQHYDHLDILSLRKIGQAVRIIAPAGAASLLKKNLFTHVEEICIGETVQVGDVSLEAVYADHTGKRHPMGKEADCIGFIINDSKKIYFPGDTRLFPEMADLAEGLDVALMPVWGWGFNRGKLHMGPLEAAQALTLLHPRVAIPIHWGTFVPSGTAWLRPPFLYFPPLDFLSAARKIAPEVQVVILKPGESLQFNPVIPNQMV